MTDPTSVDTREALAGQDRPSPGALLRQARESRRMHIGVLAATLKVPVQRLEALEADRYADLLDATFTRSLANSVCRVLKVDPAPILLGLPRQDSVASTLADLHGGQRQPTGSRRARVDDARESGRGLRVAALILLVLALVVWLAPMAKTWLEQRLLSPVTPEAPPAAAPAQLPESAGPEGPSKSSSDSSGVTTPQTAESVVEHNTLDAAPKLEAKGESWVEIKDGQGTVTWSGTVASGQTVTLEGSAPWSLIIGNVSAVILRHKGIEVDLEPHTKANVARLTLNP